MHATFVTTGFVFLFHNSMISSYCRPSLGTHSIISHFSCASNLGQFPLAIHHLVVITDKVVSCSNLSLLSLSTLFLHCTSISHGSRALSQQVACCRLPLICLRFLQPEYHASARPCRVPVGSETIYSEPEDFRTPSEDSGLGLGPAELGPSRR